MKISPLAGKHPENDKLTDIAHLVRAYDEIIPDPSTPSQCVEFGTSGHRGSSLKGSFNECHILAITQAICDYRSKEKIDGPLFLGMDTHALSLPAWQSALEVLAANGVTAMISEGEVYTPTPAISHAILTYNRGRQHCFADGIVITPSHNPPDEGGFKYNPPHGGPAGTEVTNWIQHRANELLDNGLQGIKKIPLEEALEAPKTQKYNYLKAYVEDLCAVIDMDVIRNSKIHIGVDPLGGAGVHYWKAIAQRYDLNLTVVNETVDPTFRFMTLDWDGKIRMDPSSPYAMEGLIGMKDRFDISFACDTDYDRHGIVTKSSGLLQPNHYLSAAIFYLFQHRPHWKVDAAVGKTLVSSQMIDRVVAKLSRGLCEVPVGFKWFVEGLSDGSLAFTGEESAGATFVRMDGTPWTTDKDGIILALLAAEMTARLGKDPGDFYKELTLEFGSPVYDRIEASATSTQKARLKNLSAADISIKTLAGEPIVSVLSEAPGNGAPIGGIKVVTANGWFAARPSGTEEIYKIYGESFLGQKHLQSILKEAQAVVDHILD